MSTSRRGFLQLGAGVAAAWPMLHSRRQASTDGDLEQIAATLRRTPHAEVVAAAKDLLGHGASWRDVLGGVFLAGIQDVDSRPVGFKFHCVMMVGAAFALAERAEPQQRLVPVLFNLDDFKKAQAQDASQGDWVMPPRPKVREVRAARAAALLRAALDEWDDAKADHAAVQVHGCMDLDAAFELLWPFAARDYGSIGHKMIFTAQAYRSLQQIGWRHGESVLRSLVRALLAGKPGRTTAPFEPNLVLGRTLREGWMLGKDDPLASARLLATLRAADPLAAAAAVVALVNDGWRARVAWDALGLMAAELLLRKPGILAVHPTTAVNALHIAARTSRDDTTQRLAMLQAASWLAMFRDDLKAGEGARLDELEPDALPAAAQDCLPGAPGERVHAARTALAFAQDEERALALRDAAQARVLHKAREHHQYKYMAALLEEHALAHPRWAPYLLAASTSYLPVGSEPDAPFVAQAREAQR